MKKSACLLCWLVQIGLSWAATVPGVRFEAVPAVIRAGQRATIRIQHSDSHPSSVWQILPSGRQVPVTRFTGPLRSGVSVPVMPPTTMRYELALEGSPLTKGRRLTTQLRVVRPGDPHQGHPPVIEAFSRRAPDSVGMGSLPRDNKGLFRITFTMQLRHADTVRIYGDPVRVAIWPEKQKTFAVPPAQSKGVFRREVTVKPNPFLRRYVLAVENSNARVRSALPPPYGAEHGSITTAQLAPPGLGVDTRRPKILRFDVLEAPAAMVARPPSPGRPLVLRPVRPGTAPLSLTARVNVSFDVERAAVVRLFAGPNLVWESGELPLGRLTRTIPLTALRGTVFELRALSETKATTQKAQLQAPGTGTKGKGPGGLFH